MSGILAVLALDGSPLGRRAVRPLARAMEFRGPDGTRLWQEGPVALAAAELATTPGGTGATSSLIGDASLRLVADARLDGRETLAAELAAAGAAPDPGASDAALLLAAYRAWGAACAARLLGDFAFVVWDASRRRLECVRDPLGGKPLYRARVGRWLVVSNTVQVLRAHPAVSGTLDEKAVGELLALGEVIAPERTSLAAIRRIPPGHRWVAEHGRERAVRYGGLAGESPPPPRRGGDLVVRFRELLATAVADRVPAGGAAVFLSGGLDSTSVASLAAEALRRRGGPFVFRAHTLVYERLLPHDEHGFAESVTRRLGIPLEALAADDFAFCEHWDRFDAALPELMPGPLAMGDALYAAAARHARVALTGQGGDPALLPSPLRLLRLLRRGLVLQAAREALAHAVRLRRAPPTGLWAWWRARRAPSELPPAWIAPALAARVGVRALVAERMRPAWQRPVRHGQRPEAFEALAAPTWATVFEANDPGATGYRLEVRHPFFDLRLLRFLLAMAPLPWTSDKHLLREAMRGRLPESVRRRPKTSLAGVPRHALRPERRAWLAERVRTAPGLEQFVNRARLLDELERDAATLLLGSGAAAFGLAEWLHREAGTAASSPRPMERRGG